MRRFLFPATVIVALFAADVVAFDGKYSRQTLTYLQQEGQSLRAKVQNWISGFRP